MTHTHTCTHTRARELREPTRNILFKMQIMVSTKQYKFVRHKSNKLTNGKVIRDPWGLILYSKRSFDILLTVVTSQFWDIMQCETAFNFASARQNTSSLLVGKVHSPSLFPSTRYLIFCQCLGMTAVGVYRSSLLRRFWQPQDTMWLSFSSC